MPALGPSLRCQVRVLDLDCEEDNDIIAPLPSPAPVEQQSRYVLYVVHP